MIIAILQNTAGLAHVGRGQWTAPRRHPCPTARSRGVNISPARKISCGCELTASCRIRDL
eukprot:scaffold6824_cov118-Isochrysis_galbana.AAC.1